MAIAGGIKVDCGDLFPHGLGIISEVTPLADFNASTKDNRVQARDKDTNLPMWQVEVLDFDEHAREKTYRVKIAAAVQPVPPGTHRWRSRWTCTRTSCPPPYGRRPTPSIEHPDRANEAALLSALLSNGPSRAPGGVATRR